jgi:hypothetical protein
MKITQGVIDGTSFSAGLVHFDGGGEIASMIREELVGGGLQTIGFDET